ncbi:SLAM family member 5-like isoform X2 [Paramormyrops kingsleyae]|uniref:SLAM family member 5-like isoform X2 n=1 Tax=Paramormyrops kingsleyae TaxID=1676925 RepID=UPI003B972B28
MLILTRLLLISGVCVAVDLTVNGSVGGTVELPSVLGSLKVKDFDFLKWRFNGRFIAEMSSGQAKVNLHAQFKGRLQLSPDFYLTVRELRLEDSGEYQRVGMKEDGSQIPAYKIQLQVNEPITSVWIQPEYTWDPENHTCAVRLVCNSSGGLRPSYTWRMRDQTESSSRLHFFLSPTEGNVTITCTAANAASQMSRNHTVRCIPTGDQTTAPPVGFSPCLLKMVVFSVGLIIMVSAVITVHLRERFYRQREHVQGAETEGTAPLGGRL